MIVAPVLFAAFVCPPKTPATAETNPFEPSAFPYPLLTANDTDSSRKPTKWSDGARIQLTAAGQVKFTSDRYTATADGLSVVGRKLLFNGNVKITLRVPGQQPVSVRAESIEIKLDGSTLQVRGGKM